MLNTIFVGREWIGLEEFQETSYAPSNKIFVNEGMSLYKLLGFKNPGILQCLGMCNKKMKERKLKLESTYSSIKPGTFKFDMNFQLGGSLLVSNKGKIIFKYSMNYVGDHCKPEEIIISALNFVYKSERMGIDMMNGARSKVSNKSSLSLKVRLKKMKSIQEKEDENISEHISEKKSVPTENSIKNNTILGIKSLLTVESIPIEQNIAVISDSKTNGDIEESSKETWTNF